MPGISVLSDMPVSSADDQLRFDRYVDPLVSLLTDPRSRTPFTIGVLGAWGSGKSSVLTMVDERLAAEAPETFLRVHFNPWVHRREPNMLAPLLQTIRDTLLADRSRRFLDSAAKMSALLGTLAADALLTTITAGRLSIEKIDAAANRLAQDQALIRSEMHNLRGTLHGQLAELQKSDVRTAVFIDDVDRCEPDQIIDLLESIKLFLDVPGIFVVMAVSKELVDRGVSIKYQGFGFDRNGLVDIGEEYLEKMIQLPLYLLPLDSRGVRALLESSSPPGIAREHAETLTTILMPNPRKIKRVLNFLAVTGDIVKGTPGLDGLHSDLIVRLAVLRVQSPRLFAAILAEPRVLLVMEQLYGGLLEFDAGSFGTRFGSGAGENLFQIVAPHYRQIPFLAPLFGTSSFGAQEDSLVDYLTLFGRSAI